MKYKILLFDLDDTLLDFRTTEKETLKKLFYALGYLFTEEIEREFNKINTHLWKEYIDGKIEIQEAFYKRFKILFKKIGIEKNERIVEKIHKKIFVSENHIIEGAFEVCEKLSKKYDMYVTSNGLKNLQEERLIKSGLSRFFKKIYTSDELGATKPATRFFEKILKELHVIDTKEILLIGDSLSSDIVGGKNAKIDTCWFNPRKTKNNLQVNPNYEIQNLKELLNILK